MEFILEIFIKVLMIFGGVLIGSILFIALLSMLVFKYDSITSFLSPFLKRKIRNKKYELKNKCAEWKMQERKKNILRILSDSTQENFSVELSMINQIKVQDEIVRTVNLLAHQTSEACMNQDKVSRGKKIEPYQLIDDHNMSTKNISWDVRAHHLKVKWSETRKLALQLLPELIDRMPHFSEVEPLKSYNQEYLLKKKNCKL